MILEQVPCDLCASNHYIVRYIKPVYYRDDIFDGRGSWTFKFLVGKSVGFSWKKSMLERLRLHHHIGMRVGSIVDKLVFSLHWEASLKRNGIMVATYEKA